MVDIGHWDGQCAHLTVADMNVARDRSCGTALRVRRMNGQRLPARFGQPEVRKQVMSTTRKFSLGLLGAFVAVMLAEPAGGHADCATRPATPSGHPYVHSPATSPLPAA